MATATSEPGDAADLGSLQNRRDMLAERNLDAQGMLSKIRVAHSIAYAIKTVGPKTADTVNLLDRWVDPVNPFLAPRVKAFTAPARDDRMDIDSRMDAAKEIHETLLTRPVWWVVGTSLLFEAAVLALAGWIFCRRDY